MQHVDEPLSAASTPAEALGDKMSSEMEQKCLSKVSHKKGTFYAVRTLQTLADLSLTSPKSSASARVLISTFVQATRVCGSWLL